MIQPMREQQPRGEAGTRGTAIWLGPVRAGRRAVALAGCASLLVAVMAVPAGAATGGGSTVTEFAIPSASSNPFGIVAGPDGALWFTEFGGNKIGRITTAGAVTESTIPTANSAPRGIVAGPDGALWFTERDGNKIGRITTAGAVTESTIPTANLDRAAGS